MVLHRFTVLANVQGLAAPVRKGKKKKFQLEAHSLSQSSNCWSTSSALPGKDWRAKSSMTFTYTDTQPPLWRLQKLGGWGTGCLGSCKQEQGCAAQAEDTPRDCREGACKLRKWDGRVWGKSCWRLIWEVRRKELGRTRSVVLYSSAPSRSGSSSGSNIDRWLRDS